MKRVIFIILAVIGLQSCATMYVPPGVSVDRDEFSLTDWTVAVLDLDYEYEEQGSIGATDYISAGENGGNVIADILATELPNLGNIRIIERENLADIIDEQALQLSGMVDAESAVEIGRLSGADAVIIGELTDYVYWENTGVTGTTISFSMKMISVESGNVVLSGSISRVRSLTDIFPNAQLTTRELVEAIEGKM